MIPHIVYSWLKVWLIHWSRGSYGFRPPYFIYSLLFVVAFSPHGSWLIEWTIWRWHVAQKWKLKIWTLSWIKIKAKQFSRLRLTWGIWLRFTFSTTNYIKREMIVHCLLQLSITKEYVLLSNIQDAVWLEWWWIHSCHMTIQRKCVSLMVNILDANKSSNNHNGISSTLFSPWFLPNLTPVTYDHTTTKWWFLLKIWYDSIWTGNRPSKQKISTRSQNIIFSSLTTLWAWFKFSIKCYLQEILMNTSFSYSAKFSIFKRDKKNI